VFNVKLPHLPLAVYAQFSGAALLMQVIGDGAIVVLVVAGTASDVLVVASAFVVLVVASAVGGSEGFGVVSLHSRHLSVTFGKLLQDGCKGGHPFGLVG
jgi:hypothetical protein